ncbi:MAG: hypothetical protein LBR22_05650 [Desulfovibrio sp.]|nr:hypothetical protein [Desulfovibrio sp.]
MLSTFRASGRLFWGVSYLLLIIACIAIFSRFNAKRQIYIGILALTLQLVDLKLAYPINVNDVQFDNITNAFSNAISQQMSREQMHYVNTNGANLQSNEFYHMLMVLAERRIPVTAVNSARPIQTHDKKTCLQTLQEGGGCIVTKEEMKSIGIDMDSYQCILFPEHIFILPRK